MLSKLKNFWQKQSKKKKIIIIAVAALLLFLILRPKNSDDEVTYQTAKVSKGNISQVVSETGEITTANKVDIGTTITGVVTEVYVENGSMVEEGDKLFYVESDATDVERSQAYSAYLTAKTGLESAKSRSNSLESSMWAAHEDFEERALDTELSVDDPIYIQTQRDWLAAESDYLNQEEVIAQSQAALNNAWLDYQATVNGVVKATADGQVANLSLAAGQTVAADDTALIIKTKSETWVEIAVNESDVIAVVPGQKAVVEIDALDDEIAVATVQRVDEFATVVSDIALYYVYLTLDEVPQNLRPGMTTQVDITTQEVTNVLVVSNSAIKPYQGEKAVQIMEGDSVFYQPIEMGISGDLYTEVISGLEEGQEIIVSSTGSNDSSGGGFFMRPGK